MYWFDISVIVLLVISTLYSLIRGLIKEIFSLASFIIAFILAHRYYSEVSSSISDFVSNNTAADLLSFVMVFIFSALIISLVGRFVRSLLHQAKTLSFADRAAGGFLGLIKGVLIIAVIMVPLGLVPTVKKEILSKSKFAPYILNVSRELSKISLSDKNILDNFSNKIKLQEMKEKLLTGVENLKESLKDMDKLKKGLKSVDNLTERLKDAGKDIMEKKERIKEGAGKKLILKKKDKSNKTALDNITEEDRKKLNEIIEKSL